MLDSIGKVFQTDLDEFKHKHRELQDLVATSFGKSKASKSKIRAHVNGGNPDGTACSSRADCDSLSKKLNMCSDMRVAALQTYEAVNKMVHALQAVLRLSCACLFEGPVTVCALAGFPYTCSVFYGGYQGLFSTSRGLYVLSGALVQTCSALSGLLYTFSSSFRNCSSFQISQMARLALFMATWFATGYAARGIPGLPSKGATASPQNGGQKSSTPVQATVEINLTPPRRPYPQLAAQIEFLDRRRGPIQTEQYANLTAAFEAELKRASTEIPKVIAGFFETFDDPTIVSHLPLSSSSLIQKGDIDVEVVENGGAVDPEIGERVKALENYRETWANKTHADGLQFLKSVTNRVLLVLNETLINQMRPLVQYKREALIELQSDHDLAQRCNAVNTKLKKKIECPTLRANFSSFLQTGPSLPGAIFGGSVTVMKLVEDLETRRDVGEDLATNQRLYAALRLATEELKLIEQILSATVAGILEHYRDAIKLLVEKYKPRK